MWPFTLHVKRLLMHTAFELRCAGRECLLNSAGGGVSMDFAPSRICAHLLPLSRRQLCLNAVIWLCFYQTQFSLVVLHIGFEELSSTRPFLLTTSLWLLFADSMSDNNTSSPGRKTAPNG